VLVGRRILYNPTENEALFLALVGGGRNTLYVVVLEDDGHIAEWAVTQITVLGPVDIGGPYR
jgi:hypothetical protein